jgi:chemotaxis signal transduction protein
VASPEGLPAGGGAPRKLLFRAGGERFALDVAYVREILPPREPTPVPLVPEPVVGIVNHRGAIFTLVSFARLAGLGDEEGGSIVLLRVPGMALGLTVARIEGIEPVSEGPAAGEARLPGAPFVRAGADERGRSVHALDEDALVDTIYGICGPGQAAGA